MFRILCFGNRHQRWSDKTAAGASREGDRKCRADDDIWLQELFSAGVESVRLRQRSSARSSCTFVDWQREEIVRDWRKCADLRNGRFISCVAWSEEGLQCNGLFIFCLLRALFSQFIKCLQCLNSVCRHMLQVPVKCQSAYQPVFVSLSAV